MTDQDVQIRTMLQSRNLLIQIVNDGEVQKLNVNFDLAKTLRDVSIVIGFFGVTVYCVYLH